MRVVTSSAWIVCEDGHKCYPPHMIFLIMICGFCRWVAQDADCGLLSFGRNNTSGKIDLEKRCLLQNNYLIARIVRLSMKITGMYQ
jgi:hypothetical protein